jgi:hypothetical protein
MALEMTRAAIAPQIANLQSIRAGIVRSNE